MQAVEQSKSTSFLDRPVLGGIRLDWWTLIYTLLIVLAIGTRFASLGPRAYSHDESIHASWSWDLYTGRGYQHNPTYHGPFLYHFTAFIFFLFGDSDVTGRVSPAIFGLAVVLLPLLMRKWLGKKGTLVATAMLVISPLVMARSRYLRMDIYTIAFEIAMVIAIFKYLEERKQGYLYLMAASLSLAFCAKETAYIYAAIFGSFLAILLLARWLKADRSVKRWWECAEFDLVVMKGTLLLPLSSAFWVKLMGWDPIDYSNDGMIRSGAVFLVMLAVSAAIGIWWDRKRWLVAAGIYYIIFASFFTTMFTNGKGFATGMMGSLGYWLGQQDVKRGGQPWFYYLLLIPMYDFLPFLFSILGGGHALLKWRKGAGDGQASGESRVPFVPFLIYWSVLGFLAYTLAAEKMPWLGLNMIIPIILLAGWYVGQLLEKVDFQSFKERGGWVAVLLVPLFLTVLITLISTQPFQGTAIDQLSDTTQWLVALLATLGVAVALYLTGRRLGLARSMQALLLVTLIVLSALTIRFAWMATFRYGDVPVELMVYAQGSPDIRAAMDEIIQLSERTEGGLQLKVAYDDESSWPFVWYLRNFKNAQFYAKKPGAPFDAPVVLVGDGNEPGIKPFLGAKYFRREYKLIWWPTESYKSLTLRQVIDGIGDVEVRRNLWNILFYRKYSYDLDNWPHFNKFMMYVRKDIAAQLWDYGPEIIATEIELPGEEYDKAYQQIPAQSFWGREGVGDGELRFPKGIALDGQGNVYVADSQNHRIVQFDANGGFLANWGSEGSGPGQFKEPWGVAVGEDGSIYVADTWNHRIQKLDSQGQFVTMWGVFGDTGGASQGTESLLYGPRDVVIDANGDLYVTDTGNKRVLKYGPNGQYIAQHGVTGVEPGEFLEPVGLAIDVQGNIYVADTWNRRIQKFDADFRPRAQWPFAGWDGESVVNKPYLDVDSLGNIYVSDPEMFRIVKLDPQGKVLLVWGQLGMDSSSLNLPTGIKVDAAGNIYVSDSNNHRLVKYGSVN